MACETVSKCCFSGRGKIYLGKYDACCGVGDDGVDPYPLIDLGNVTAFTIDATINDFSVEDMTTAAGGNFCKYSEVADPVVNMDITCLDADNMAKAFAALKTEVAAATGITQTAKVRALSSFIPFKANGEPVTAAKVETVTVEIAEIPEVPEVIADPGATPPVVGSPAIPAVPAVPLVKGTDYEVTPQGIEILSTSTNFTFPAAVPPQTVTPGVEISINFDHDAYSLLNLLTESGTEYALYFDGINAAAGGAAFSGQLYRIKPRPATGIPFISKEIARWSMTADILSDNCQTGTSSKYGTFGF